MTKMDEFGNFLQGLVDNVVAWNRGDAEIKIEPATVDVSVVSCTTCWRDGVRWLDYRGKIKLTRPYNVDGTVEQVLETMIGFPGATDGPLLRHAAMLAWYAIGNEAALTQHQQTVADLNALIETKKAELKGAAVA